jgi:hypothetical protein
MLGFLGLSLLCCWVVIVYPTMDITKASESALRQSERAYSRALATARDIAAKRQVGRTARSALEAAEKARARANAARDAARVARTAAILALVRADTMSAAWDAHTLVSGTTLAALAADEALDAAKRTVRAARALVRDRTDRAAQHTAAVALRAIDAARSAVDAARDVPRPPRQPRRPRPMTLERVLHLENRRR